MLPTGFLRSVTLRWSRTVRNTGRSLRIGEHREVGSLSIRGPWFGDGDRHMTYWHG